MISKPTHINDYGNEDDQGHNDRDDDFDEYDEHDGTSDDRDCEYHDY